MAVNLIRAIFGRRKLAETVLKDDDATLRDRRAAARLELRQAIAELEKARGAVARKTKMDETS